MIRVSCLIIFHVMMLSFLITSSSFAVTQNRSALVIGNGAYSKGALENPVNDANDMMQALKKCGFSVIQQLNASKRQILSSIIDFGAELKKGETVGLFYYAGHGLQIDGANYLVPIDAKIYSKYSVKKDCIDLSLIIHHMKMAENPVNIVILDACLDNPFSDAISNTGFIGLSIPEGMILSYATSPGTIARDGFGQNGLYTSKLLKYMLTPGLPIEKLFKNVRISVSAASQKNQIPWESSSLTEDFSFIPERKVVANEYSPSVDIPNLHIQPHADPVSSELPDSMIIGNTLGMQFVYILPGTFMMGSPSDEEGRSKDEIRHPVILTRGFFMQTTEVTQWQWETVMGYNPSVFKRCGPDCPVEWISWNEVQKFIEKINRLEKTTKYRLPTEAEWEYVARAGNQTRFFYGNDDTNLANYAWYVLNASHHPHPVGQKKANPWGVYDLNGNVWEWCEDTYIYNAYTDQRRLNPITVSGNHRKVIRGGSWKNNVEYLRNAYRGNYPPSYKNNALGFRLVIDP